MKGFEKEIPGWQGVYCDAGNPINDCGKSEGNAAVLEIHNTGRNTCAQTDSRDRRRQRDHMAYGGRIWADAQLRLRGSANLDDFERIKLGRIHAVAVIVGDNEVAPCRRRVDKRYRRELPC